MTDDSAWQKTRPPLFPRRTVDGGWISGAGQTWRRRRPDGKWEYRQDEETEEAWLDRQM